MSRGRPKRTLHTLYTEGPKADEIMEIHDEIMASSDRNAAIMAAANLDWQLGVLIVKSLPNVNDETRDRLFDKDGPLSSSFSKNFLGFALNLYDKQTLADLEIIRNVRNVFAHAPRALKFSTPEIAAKCRGLKQGRDHEYEAFLKKHGISGDGTLRMSYLIACIDYQNRFQDLEAKLVKAAYRKEMRRLNKVLKDLQQLVAK
jgi:hypothetical protein